MNYYEHHLGDYAKDAGHLTLIREGAYRRLIDVYYSREAPLPADIEQCCELARVTSKPERQAVVDVLERFFDLQADGYHQKRCDEEIEKYLESEPEREEKKKAGKERQRRYRERRANLFAQLRELGVVASFNASNTDLEKLLARELSRVTVSGGDADITRDERVTNKPVTRYMTATIPQSPVSSLQTPNKEHTHTPKTAVTSARAREGPSRTSDRSVCVDEDFDLKEREDAARG